MIQTEGFILTQFGQPEKAFQLRSLQLSINEKQLLVEVTAFGLNYADVMARLGKYRETPALPTTIGYEVVGKIIQVGQEIDSELIGKRVLAFTHFGGYAKHSVIEKDAFVLLDEQIDDASALALCTQYVTAYYMSCYQSTIRKGDIVLIHAAAGGVGSGLIQMCKNNGAVVIAKVGTDDKISRAKEIGADEVINYKKEEYSQKVAQILNGKKLTYSFNPVGGDTFKKDIRLLGANGKIVLFGGSELSNGKFGVLSQLNFLRKMGRIIPAFWMMKSKSMLTVNMLRIALEQPQIIKQCLEDVQQLYLDGELKVFIDHIYNASELNEAHHRLESGKSMGKIVVKW